MVIDTIKEIIDGKKVEIAPVTVFDAIIKSESDSTTLNQALLDLYKTIPSISNQTYCYTMTAEWEDGNPAKNTRVGKFVTMISGTGKIRIAGPKDDIYGVVVTSDNKTEETDKVFDDKSSALICIYGIAPVITSTEISDIDLKRGVRMTVSKSGYGEKSESEYGFVITDKIDETNYKIAIIPGMNLIQSIHIQLSTIAEKVDDLLSRFPDEVSVSVEDGDVIISNE